MSDLHERTPSAVSVILAIAAVAIVAVFLALRIDWDEINKERETRGVFESAIALKGRIAPKNQSSEVTPDPYDPLRSQYDIEDKQTDDAFWDLARRITQVGPDADVAEQELRSKLDWLVSSDKVGVVMSRIPMPARLRFRDVIIDLYERKRMQLEVNRYDSEYHSAVRLIAELRMEAQAANLIEDLTKVPPYHFPNEDPNPWDIKNAIHGYKGLQGEIARAVVLIETPGARELFRKELELASGELRHVLIWSLGQSTNESDFDYLMEMGARVRTIDEKEWITRSLNRIPLALEQEAIRMVNPGGDPTDPVIQRMETLSDELRQRLKSQGLDRTLSVWD